MLDLIFGGLTGLIGTIWGGYNNRKLKELDMQSKSHEHQYNLAIIKAESDALIVEANANIKITSAITNGAIELAEIDAFSKSQEYGNLRSLPTTFAENLADVKGWSRVITVPMLAILTFLLGLADVIKGMARPAITVYLLAVATWLSVEAWQLLEVTNATSAISSIQAVAIVEQSISVLMYLATTAVTWWFGDRMTEKGYNKLFKKN